MKFARLAAVGVVVVMSSVQVLGAASATSGPSLSALKASIAASVQLHSVDLNTSIPPIQDLSATTAQRLLPLSCYVNPDTGLLPKNVATLCAIGDTRATRTIVLTGDSQAGMWLPGLNSVAKSLSWKLILVSMPGCAPWIVPATVPIVNGFDAGCRTFRQSVRALVLRLRPQVVIPVGLSGYYGNGVFPTEPQLLAEMTAMFHGWKSVNPLNVVFSPIPQFGRSSNVTPPIACLATQPDPTKCEFPLSQLQDKGLWTALEQESSTKSARFVDLTSLFCSAQACPVVVGPARNAHLIYLDSSHMNRLYSAWISSALTSLLKPVL